MADSNVDTVIKQLDKLKKEIGKDVASSLYMAGEIVRGTAVKSIQKQSQGEAVTRYRRGGAKYSHVASKPGDAPNTDTGNLVKNIAVEPGDESVFVGTNVEYGAWLEIGTKDMAARPWLRPALKSNRKKINKLIQTAINKQVREANQ